MTASPTAASPWRLSDGADLKPARCLISTLLLLCALLLPLSAGAATVRTGAEMLQDSGFARLRGVKFGLVTNQTATVGGRHLLELLRAAGVPPAVIFVPEHGLKGAQEDGVQIRDAVEQGIPVRSLYGGTKKPRQEDLAGLKLLVFDIQDIGSRFYTYIATMGLVMQAAADARLPLIILDRPNPLGGIYLAGFVSRVTPPIFTALYPIPITHGMTVGELAQMIRGENMLPGLKKLDLTVVKMSGWQRWMRWPDTGLSWTATSPNIPDFTTALLYAGVGLLEGTRASEGRGTETPFRLAGWPGIDSSLLATRLNSENLPGVSFTATSFTPHSIPGRASSPKYRDRTISGINITVTEHGRLQPVEIGVAIVRAIYSALPAREQQNFFRKGLDDLAGNTLLRQAVVKGSTTGEITALWRDEVARFTEQRRPYLLYPD
ncbi:MAG: DUF1343 domain-containing protein [Geobacter sp.]|nr:DUF1343 domain-containing protein [Geobacter sp.]